MTNIIVVLPKLEEAKGVKSILVRSGFQVTGICTTGTQAISQMDGLNDGIVICSYKLADMIYTELHEDLPEGFEMLLMASRNLISECYGNGIVCLSMPLKVQDLINTVNLMVEGVERRRRKRRMQPKKSYDRRRSPPVSSEDQYGQWDESGGDGTDGAVDDDRVTTGGTAIHEIYKNAGLWQ